MRGIVVFDVDGTLFDTKEGIIKALNIVLENNGMNQIQEKDEDEYIGPPIKYSLKKFYVLDDAEADKLVEEYRTYYIDHTIKESRLYVGTTELIECLKLRGYSVGIATLKTYPQVHALLKYNNMLESFDIIRTANAKGGVSKSDMLGQIRAVFKCDTDEFIFIGDTVGDFNAANEMDYKFIAADYGYGDVKMLECSHIDSIESMLRVMKGK